MNVPRCTLLLALLGNCVSRSTVSASLGASSCIREATNDAAAEFDDINREELGELGVQLLQRKLNLRQPQDDAAQHTKTGGTEQLQAAFPLAWTHVPKCGSSLVNTLIRLPGACPGLPSNASDVIWGGSGSTSNYTTFAQAFPDWEERCPGLRRLPFSGANMGEHVSVGSFFEDIYDGHGIIMLRQPEQRMISMYTHIGNRNDTYGLSLRSMFGSISEFANTTEGCAVRMLTKQPEGRDGRNIGWNACMGIGLPGVTDADVTEARRRLRRYAFVGITDQWGLSICLLHAMFGGDCHPAEFANVRRNPSSQADHYDTGLLDGFVDHFDGALYKDAMSIFADNLRRYNATMNSCQRCFQAAGF